MEARMFATTWLTQMLQVYEHSLDPVKDFPTIERSITAALNDGHIKVREAARITYWQYAKLSHTTADKIMDDISQHNPHAATALRADPHNPNKSIQAQAVDGPRPKSALSQIRAAKSKQAQQTVKRNITPMSVQSVESLEMMFGSIDRLDDPDRHADARPHPPQSRQPEAEQAANVRHLMSAPRRPRVVATPIQPYQPQVASRPSSKGEATKKPSESKERPAHEKRGGRQTPVIAEDNEHQTISHHTKKSSIQRHKPESSVSSVTRPTSSSSEPAAIRSPRRMTEPRKPAQAVPPKHQKSLSTSEARANTRPEPVQLKTMSDPYPSEDKENPEPLRLKAMSSSQSIEGKENASRDFAPPKPARATSPSIDRARRSIPKIVDAIRHDQLDALGYRKLQKLVENNPHELLLSQEQYTELYSTLLEALYRPEVVERDTPEWQFRTINHPAYNRFSILHTVLALFDQYPNFDEPKHGETVKALVKARNLMGDNYPRVVEALTKSAEAICLSSRITSDPFPSVAQLLDFIDRTERKACEDEQAIDACAREDPKFVVGIGFCLNLLTTILKTIANSGRQLDSLHEQQLAALAKAMLATYRTVLRRETIQYCCALYKLIEPEDRFFDMFEEESDRNLIYYCIKNQAVGSS